MAGVASYIDKNKYGDADRDDSDEDEDETKKYSAFTPMTKRIKIHEDAVAKV